MRAGVTDPPYGHRWSIYRHHVGQGYDLSGSIPVRFRGARTDEERGQHYAELMRSADPDGKWTLIREALPCRQLTGNARHIDEVAAILGRRIEHRKLRATAPGGRKI